MRLLELQSPRKTGKPLPINAVALFSSPSGAQEIAEDDGVEDVDEPKPLRGRACSLMVCQYTTSVTPTAFLECSYPFSACVTRAIIVISLRGDSI